MSTTGPLLADIVVDHGDAANHVRVYGRTAGRGEYVVLVPSLGRGVEDFTENYNCTITSRLAQAGYRVVLVQPRGIGLSHGDLTPGAITMEVLVDDLRRSLDALGIARAHFAGHAFGNRLVRSFATFHPDHVIDVTLLAAGGNFPLTEEQLKTLRQCFNLALPDEERLVHIARAFFAARSDPTAWLDGWYPALALAQMAAARSIDGDLYKAAGGAPILLVQAADDYIAPPELAGRPLAEELGDQVTYVEIPNTNHALTSERPDEIAARMIAYYRQER